MSIDERLEALTQTVELLAGMHKDLIEAQKNTDRMLVQVMEGLGKLVYVVQTHERRLDDLEGQP